MYFCRVGHYCPGGTAAQKPCPINEMANYTHASKCDPCPAGYYCLKSGVPIACEKGFYCPAGTGKDLRPCPRGTIGPEKQYSAVQDCKPCPIGKYCLYTNATTYTGECTAGHWCNYGVDRATPIGVNKTSNESYSNSSCYDGRETGYGGRCPVGHYCPAGIGLPEPCPIGSYAPIEGLSQCYTCMEGYYCPLTNLTDFYSYKCPTGHYCPNGTKTANEYPCHSGTYSDVEKNTKLQDCKSCLPGRFCPVTGMCNFH